LIGGAIPCRENDLLYFRENQCISDPEICSRQFRSHLAKDLGVERVTGIEPAWPAWKADDLEPLTCSFTVLESTRATCVQ